MGRRSCVPAFGAAGQGAAFPRSSEWAQWPDAAFLVRAAGVGAAYVLALTIGVGGCARVASGNPSGAGAAGGNATDGGGADQPSEPGGGGTGATDCRTCSADQRAVIGCSGGAVIKTCADNQACQMGDCVDGCAIAQSTGSAQGCDFYSVIPPPGFSSDGSCFAAMLANTWSAPITITVGYGGQSLDVAAIARRPSTVGPVVTYAPLPGGKLDPGQMAILFLNNAPGDPRLGTANHIDCPIPAGVTTPVAVAGTGTGQAFHIKTSAPVAAYDIYPYGGAESHVSSATLLIPTSAWGTNYVATDGYQRGTNGSGSPSVQIVAVQDDTQVTINPTAPIIGGTGVAAAGRGQPHIYSLSAGQVLQFLQPDELAGSAISASKAVGVWGGSSCMKIPVDLGACDAAHQQQVPVNLLGHEYTAVRYRDRLKGKPEMVPWTMIGAVNGTTLTYDPAPPAGAPATINRGQSVEFTTGDAFTVKSADEQHPFYLAGHMTGFQALGDDNFSQGDPETVNTVPPQQWLNSYVFLTDPTYSDTNLVFVRKKVGVSFSDVTLDCVGALANWKPVGMAGDYEFTTVDLVTASQPQGTCNNGVHTARSDAPFGLTVWGWDKAVSYAYPAGMSVRPINKVVVIP